MEKSIGFFISLALLTTMAVFATTRSNEISSIEKQETGAMAPDTHVLVTDDLFKVLSAHGELSTFSTMLRASGLVRDLSKNGSYTIFAPNNAAFDALPSGTVETLLMPEQKASLTAVLKNHFVAGEIKSADLPGGTPMESLDGKKLTCSADQDEVKIGKASVIQTDLDMQHGVIHVIDRVLLTSE